MRSPSTVHGKLELNEQTNNENNTTIRGSY